MPGMSWQCVCTHLHETLLSICCQGERLLKMNFPFPKALAPAAAMIKPDAESLPCRNVDDKVQA